MSIPLGGKLRVEKSDWEESNSFFRDRASDLLGFFYMFVNGPGVFMMLEYNWYGQVSEPDAPAVVW